MLIIILFIPSIKNVVDELYFEGIVNELLFWYGPVTILVHGLYYRLWSQHLNLPMTHDVPHLDARLDALLALVARLGELQEAQHQLVDLLQVDAASTILVKHVKNPAETEQLDRWTFEMKINKTFFSLSSGFVRWVQFIASVNSRKSKDPLPSTSKTLENKNLK